MRKLKLRLKDHAWRCIKNFRRYRCDRSGRNAAWDQRGPFTPNQLIPSCTRRQNADCHRMMEEGGLSKRIELVDPRELRTFQRHLRVKSLLWNLKEFERMQSQSGESLPSVIELPSGVQVLWNGNHRTTVALLLGLGRVRARVFRARSTGWRTP